MEGEEERGISLEKSEELKVYVCQIGDWNQMLEMKGNLWELPGKEREMGNRMASREQKPRRKGEVECLLVQTKSEQTLKKNMQIHNAKKKKETKLQDSFSCCRRTGVMHVQQNKSEC